ncbi:MAG: PKD domain-containing protein, partial [Bacteroidota bacterium]
MRHFLQSILLWTLIGLGSTSLRAQCDIQISDLSPCGETLVTFSALNPSGNYSWDLNEDNVIDAAGSSVSYQLPSTTSDLIYSVVLYENTAPCDTLSFVIQAQPDPSIDVVPGNAIFTDDLIRACSATPQTTLQIFNASTTIPQNDTYTINWGDGTVENFTNATFPNTSFISHDYSAYGYYNITVTISGTNGCSDSRTYLFYNGSNPSVGLANPGNTVGLCAPATINFPITNTGNNPTGTEYFIYIGGEVVDSFSQNNVPAIYSYTFLESSCGLGTSTGNYENAFDVQVIASNPCGTSQATIEPIEVSTPPVPIFIVDQPTLGCVDDIFAISDASANVNEVISGNPSVCESSLSPSWTISPGVSGIDWTIVSGNIFSSNQIEIVFQTPGTYTITMTINSPACGSGSFGQTFTILEPPVAGATLDLNSAAAPSLPDECVPTLGSFINQSTGDSISFEWVVSPPTGWQYGPNSGPLEDHLDLVFDQGGTYDITLLTTNPCTTDSWDTTIVIATDPLANLTPFPPFCETATLNFDNLSVQVAENGGTISSYQWSFPGASPSSSTAALPQNIQYDSPGVYPYTLTVENQCGTHTVTDTVRVEAEGSLVLDNDYALCQDETAFQLSANPGGGTWNGTGVTIDGLFTPGSNTVGTNTLYYMYLNGACVLQDSLEVTVFPAPDVVAGASQAVCVDSPPILITGGDPVGGTWSATDGGVITGADAFDPAASGPGAYTLVYSVTNVDGCTGTDSKTIVVYDLPTVEAGPDQSLCENPNDISLTGFTPAGGVWTGTGVSPGGVFNAGNTPGPGDYTLFYTYTNPNTSCTNLDSMTVSVVPNDTARAGIDLNLCLNANPVLLSGTPANGTWSGPGVDPINNTFDPSGLNPGPQVLTYTFGTGVCETTDERIMNLVAPPQIRMIDDPRICVNDGPFDLSSVSPAGGTWQGDGLQGTSFNPALVGPGTYELRYFYQDPVTRCADIAWLNVEVLGLPELTVNDTTICNTGGAVLLPQYAPLGGSWSGTGLVDDDAFDPAVAGGTGQYDLTYTFTDAEGCTNTAISAITVVEPVQISAGPNDSICMDAGMITLGNFFPLNGTWTGTGIIDSVAGTFDPNVTGGGTHEVTYSYGLGNCRVTDTKEIHVIDLSNIHLGEAVSYCVYEAAVQFEAEGPAGGFWSGPGIVDSINGIFDPSAAGDGLHSIRYFYQDPNVGCVASATKPVTVFPMEDASFDFPAVACTNTTVAFQNTSDSSYTTQWDFGDRTSSIAFSPIHVYDTVGTYPVELIVTNEFGCRDVLVQDILITEAPDPGFALSEEEGCAPLAVEFTNQSSGFEVAFDWDFGNGESSTDISPPAIVYGPGINDTTYTVQLTVSNLCGSREVERPVLVRPLPLADFGSTPVTICSPQEVAFANISTGSATNFFWDFGNGETSTDSLPRNQIYV